MLIVYESLLYTIKNKLLQSKRTNAELTAKLHELFKDNNAEFQKLKRIYGDTGGIGYPLFDRIDYEQQKIKNYKKSRYGENYGINPIEHAKTNGG